MPITVLVGLWSGVQWLFTVWIPAWWRAVETDVSYLRNLGD
jgi:hypothetical protein